MKNKSKIYIGISVVILIFGIFLFSSTWRQSLQVSNVAEPVIPSVKTKETEKPAKPSKNTEKIILILGENTLNLSFAPNTLFYDALVEWKNAGTLTFTGKEYPSLGFFVTDIGALHSGNGKSLLYYINGKEATVGVSSYILHDGDVVEWKLE